LNLGVDGLAVGVEEPTASAAPMSQLRPMSSWPRRRVC